MTRMKALLLLLSVVTLSAAAAAGEKAAEVEVVPGVKVEVPEVKVEVPEVEVYPDVEVPEVAAVEDEHPVAAPESRFIDCPSGWRAHGRNCYLYVNSYYTWNNAQRYCAIRGASLASVDNFYEYAFLQSLTRRNSNTLTWIGGFYFQEWRWIDNSPYSYQNWNYQHSGSSYPCMYLQPNSGWSNDGCSAGRPFICKSRNGC